MKLNKCGIIIMLLFYIFKIRNIRTGMLHFSNPKFCINHPDHICIASWNWVEL